MNEEILINFSPMETRIAVIENGMLQEVHLERNDHRGIVGNIYLGKVVRTRDAMRSLQITFKNILVQLRKTFQTKLVASRNTKHCAMTCCAIRPIDRRSRISIFSSFENFGNC